MINYDIIEIDSCYDRIYLVPIHCFVFNYLLIVIVGFKTLNIK